MKLFNFGKERAICREELDRALAEAPAMSFRSPEAKKSFENVRALNKKDDGVCGIVEFAEMWARLMELEMSKGRRLNESLVAECDRLAYTIFDGTHEDVSYGHSRNLLVVHWKYGQRLMTRDLKRRYGSKPDMTQFYCESAQSS